MYIYTQLVCSHSYSRGRSWRAAARPGGCGQAPVRRARCCDGARGRRGNNITTMITTSTITMNVIISITSSSMTVFYIWFVNSSELDTVQELVAALVPSTVCILYEHYTNIHTHYMHKRVSHLDHTVNRRKAKAAHKVI